MKICFVLLFICMMLITSGVSAETITMEDAGQDVNETVQKEWIGATNNATLATFNIIDFYPTISPQLTIGESQEFHVSTNQECNIEWYFNDQLLQTNFSVLSANFTIDATTSSQYTLYNVKANASNSNGTYHIIWEFGVSSKTLHLGQTWELKDGYNLTLVVVDVVGDRALINLEKNGELLDQHIVSSNSQYYYNRSFNGTNKVIISGYVSDVFKGQISSLIQFTSIDQYSDVGTVDTNPTKLLNVGDTWEFENNYSLKFAEVENSGTDCVLFLYGNGSTVDERIIEDNSVYEYQRRNESTNDTETILEISVLNTLSLTFGGYAEFISNYSLKSDAGTVDIDPFVLVRSGESWELNDVYNTTVDETSPNKRALITLKKEDVIVDRDIIEENSIYNYNRLNLSDNTTHLILDINSSKIFNGIYNDYVQFFSEYLMYPDAGTVDIDEKKIILEGDTLELDQGYDLTLMSTDKDGNKIYIRLTKNGQSVDERILETGAHYYFNRSVYGKDQVIISFVLDKVFSGEVNRLAILKDVVQNPDIYVDDDDIIPIKKDVVEIRGPIFTGLTNGSYNAITNKVDASNFAGFYYNFNNNRGTESMTITHEGPASRAVASGNLIYTTTIMDINYLSENLKLAPPVDFQLIGYFGDEYVPIIEYRSDKLLKLLMDDDESHTIRTGQALELGEGYAIIPQQIDVDGNKVWLELTKNDKYVADKIIEVAADGSTNTWFYDQDIAGENDVLTLKIFVKQVFQGTIDSIVVIDGIWQISDSVMEVKSGDKVGKLEVTSVGGTSITMKNEDSFTLVSSSTQEIANGLFFKVADDNDLRFCLMKSFTESGMYELRGSIAEDDVFTWTPMNFQGFYYDIDNDIGIESLEILNLDNRVINKNNLTYSTTVQEMNFEYSAWNTYDGVGFMSENYFAGYPSTTFVDSAVSMISNGQLSKVLINENKNHTINSGSVLVLDEGYVLDIIEVDSNGDKAFVSLSKEGLEVDNTIIAAGNMYVYTKDLVSSDDVPIIIVHFDEIFQETGADGVILDGIFQISDNCTSLNVGDDYGCMEITSLTSTGITMENDESIYLLENSIIPIMGNIQFKVADDIDHVRFYPFVEVEIEIKPLYIDYFSPAAPVLTSYVGMDQEFKVNTNKICNFTWLINGNEIQKNHSVLSASYVNNTANPGFYNVTVVAETSNEVVQHTWNWIVISSDGDSNGVVEIRGPILTGITNDPHNASTNKVDASNFAGFYYDFNNNRGTESMTVTLDSTTSRTIAEGNLTYTTSIMDINYSSENLELAAPVGFQLIRYLADEYVPIVEDKTDKLSKLLIDDKESHTIQLGQAFELGEGYAIIPQQIDVDGDKVWLELTKNGKYIADKIIEVADDGSTNTWVYDQDIAGENDVVTLKIFVEQLQGQIEGFVVIDGIWQISDSVMEVKSDDKVGKFEVTSVGGASITMDNNDEPITLTSGSTQEIANGLSFRVADDNYLRFCLMKSFTEPGIYELRGSIAEDEVFKWTPINFQGFYYDIDNDIGTESLEILNLDNRVINKNNLTYSTTVQEMNFEYSAWGNFDVIGFFGDIFFAGYRENIFTDDVNLLSDSLMSKVLINENKNHSINSGSVLVLDEGYVLDIIEVDNNGDKVFVLLSKDGTEVHSSIISASDNYVYTATLGSSDDIPIIAVHFGEIFQGTETDGVLVDGIFQISDNCTSLNDGDDYRGMEITSLTSTGITMENGESIYLLENSIIPIMGNIQFKVADDIDNVRFYPFVEVEIEPLSIDYFSPVDSDHTSDVGIDQKFKVNTNKICNFTWLINGNETQTNHSAFSASYANNTANAGFYNVTVVAETSDEVVQHTWNWTVIVTPPTISVPTTGEIFYFPQNTTFVNGTTIGTNVSVYVNGALVNGSYPVTGGIFNISGVSLVNGMNVINVTAIYNDTVIEHFSENTSVTVSVGQILDVTNDTITLNVPGLPSGIALPFIDLNITGQGNNMPTNISLSVVAAASAPPASNMTGPAIDLSVPGNDSYTFDHPISLTLGFNASSVVNFNKTVVAWYNGSTSTWVSLKSTVNTTTNTTTANVTHFTVFAPIEDNTPPANITALTSTGQTTSSITLSWTNSSDTDYIEIWRSNAHITNVSSTSSTNSGLSSSTPYTYALRPVDIVENKGNWSNITISTESSATPNGGSGGGGGSGGTGEDYYNILKKEVKRKYVNANSEVLYEFKEETNAIDYIKFTSLKNSGTIAATIEVLKDTSSLVETKPSGEVYQNMNIWVGTAGFATPQNIANPVIGFKVERSWIENNDIVVSSIRLCRCNNDVWDHLTTREIGDDVKYIYFGADTSGFSPFAIIGYTEEEMTSQYVDEPTLGLESTMMSPPSDIASEADMGDEVPATEADTIPGLGISALMLLIGCAYLTMRGVKLP